MQCKRLSIGLETVLATFMLTLCATSTYAATERVLHSFDNNGTDGYGPHAGMISDGNGNLYGTTYEGGTGTCASQNQVVGCGAVFELSPNAGGGWTETVLHSFLNDGKDGTFPYGGLLFDGSGNLFGTTQTGGVFAYGTVFELMPKAKGVWKEKVLYSFDAGNGKDAGGPLDGLIFDKAGNLYGTSEFGGVYSFGTVFELTPKAGGGWKERVLHSFNPNTKDGVAPNGSLVVNSAGNLYGTSLEGGAFGLGTVFGLTPKAGGGWKEQVIHSFNADGKDGYLPFAGLTLDTAGNLYGATSVGGNQSGGTAFELTPKAGGGWKEKILYNFSYTTGSDPFGRLIFDGSGNLYGTAGVGGAFTFGTVFELTKNVSGKWKEKVLHDFNNDGTDGSDPMAGVIFDASGNVYGTTFHGGSSTNCSGGCGSVFEIKP